MSTEPAIEFEDFAGEQAALISWPEPIAASALCEAPPATPPALIEGILYRGGTMMISGPSKSRKTYTMLDAGISISSGEQWLGFGTDRTPVLYLNLELQDFDAQRRIASICSARGIRPPDDLHLWNLRGRRVTLAELRSRLPAKIAETGAGFVAIDPHYKVSAVSGFEENSNDGQGDLLMSLEEIVTPSGAALALSHHFAKGDPSAKNAIDRASGGGVMARWGDVMMTFTPHAEEGAMSVEMALRNFAPVAPFVVRWNHPRWARDGQLDPAKLKRSAGRTETNTADKAMESLGDGLLGWSEWLKASGMAETTFRRKKDALIAAGKVEQIGICYRKKTA